MTPPPPSSHRHRHHHRHYHVQGHKVREKFARSRNTSSKSMGNPLRDDFDEHDNRGSMVEGMGAILVDEGGDMSDSDNEVGQVRSG